MSARERPLEDVEFKELEEMMDELPSYKSSMAAQIAIKSHKEADKKQKIKLHGTFNPLAPTDECIRCMSLNPIGLAM